MRPTYIDLIPVLREQSELRKIVARERQAAEVEAAERQRFDIRTAGPAHQPAIAAMLRRLGPNTRQLRYFTPLPLHDERGEREAARLARASERGGTVLLAIHREAVIGLVELWPDPYQPGHGEFALLVSDDWQRRGVGSALFVTMRRVAEERGITVLRADLLAENRGMLGLLRAVGDAFTFRRSGREATVTIGANA